MAPFCCFGDNKAIHNESGITTKHSLKLNATRSRDNYLDFLAPSVHHLQTSFRDLIEESGLDPSTATLYDIENLRSETPGLIRTKGLNVTCPIDGDVGAAYVHCLEDEDHVGPASFMLSYCWGYEFQDIIDTLTSFCARSNLDVKRTYIWICAFCNNQHRVVDRTVPFEEFKDVFQRRVTGIGKVLAMMTPWNDPGYLKRVWCIFEMHSSHSNPNIDVSIIMPDGQKNSLMNAVMKPTDENGTSGLDELFNTLASTKVENANASQEQDKTNILRLVNESGGCSKFNAEINVLLRQWIRDTVLESVDNAERKLANEDYSEMSLQELGTYLTYCASFFSRVGAHKEALDLHRRGLEVYRSMGNEGEDGEEFSENVKELMARCYNNMGTECESLGHYEKALEYHNKCRESFEDIYGTEHENTSVSYFNIGAVLRKLNKDDEALEMYQKSMDIDIKIKGENHIDVALSYSYIGRIRQSNGDMEGALDYFEKSFQIREDTYGKNHPDTAIGYGDIGLLYHAKGEYDKAIETHEKAIAITDQVLGTLHPDSASSYQNLGGAYYEKGMYDKALELHNKARTAYETTLGYDHPKSQTSREWVSIVEDAM